MTGEFQRSLKEQVIENQALFFQASHNTLSDEVHFVPLRHTRVH